MLFFLWYNYFENAHGDRYRYVRVLFCCLVNYIVWINNFGTKTATFYYSDVERKQKKSFQLKERKNMVMFVLITIMWLSNMD